MWDVQMFDVSNPATRHTVYADSGRASFSGNGTDMILQLYDGHAREVSSGEPASCRRVYFQKQVFGVPDVGNQLQRNDRPDGYRGDREMTIGMLQAQIDTLARQRAEETKTLRESALQDLEFALTGKDPEVDQPGATGVEIGRASCRERVGGAEGGGGGENKRRGEGE